MINLARYVRENPLDGETPADLAKQGYVIMNIYELLFLEKEITINNLMDLNGFSRQTNLNIVTSLVTKRVLDEEVTRNSWGRGRLYVYKVSDFAQALSERVPRPSAGD